MKLRILDNSIRFRLSKSEIEKLADTGQVRKAIQFPGGQIFKYGIVTDDDIQDIHIRFIESSIYVSIPLNQAKQLAATDQVGVYYNYATENSDQIKISIEKDFKCLNPRDENETDLYPNPGKTH